MSLQYNWLFSVVLWKRTRIKIPLNFRFSKIEISCWPSKMLQLRRRRRIGLVVHWDFLSGRKSSVAMNMMSANKHRFSKRWRAAIINLFHSLTIFPTRMEMRFPRCSRDHLWSFAFQHLAGNMSSQKSSATSLRFPCSLPAH